LAAATYAIVENPLRHRRVPATRAVLLGIGSVVVALAMLTALVAIT
jgi:hypothetical protein